MALPTLRQGDRHWLILKVRPKLVTFLRNQGRITLAREIDNDSPVFGPSLRTAVIHYQRARGLTADGVLGPATLTKLGFNPNPYAGMVLRGIPWQPGVAPIDGTWCIVGIRRILLAERKAGRWTGRHNSGWRPDWYQKLLFDAAVRRYGSYAAASKWVAPPGRSAHRFRDPRGASDVSNAWQLVPRVRALYLPMSWEPWHLQLRAAYGVRVLGAIPDSMPVVGSLVPSQPVEDTSILDAATGAPIGMDMALLAGHLNEELDLLELRAEGNYDA